MSNTTPFCFIPAELDDIIREISSLYNKKNDTFKNIPKRQLKDALDIYGPI